MIHLQNVKFLNLIPPVAIKDNAAFVTTEIDTKGYDYATFVVNLGVTDIAMAALKITECATSGGSFTDVTGLDADGDTDTDGATSTLPTATDDGGVFVFEVDLRNTERFLDLSATAGDGSAGTYASGVCILSRAHDVPVTAAERGCLNILRA